jgi:hypothetical protein
VNRHQPNDQLDDRLRIAMAHTPASEHGARPLVRFVGGHGDRANRGISLAKLW